MMAIIGFIILMVGWIGCSVISIRRLGDSNARMAFFTTMVAIGALLMGCIIGRNHEKAKNNKNPSVVIEQDGTEFSGEIVEFKLRLKAIKEEKNDKE